MTQPAPKHLRFREFLRRLEQLPLANSHDDARRLIDTTLNAVEDELSGVPFQPQNWRSDGRMYPVQDDNAADVPGHPEVTSYRSKRHETFIRTNGAFVIRDVTTDSLVIEKPGSDGRGVWQ